jgi:multicomponent Na+:H+ antiporter subunit E
MNRNMMLTAILLGILWISLSGHFDALQLSLGLISCALVILLVIRLNLFRGNTRLSIPGMCLYTLWLIREITVANIRMVRIIVAPADTIVRRVVRTKPLQGTPLGVAIYANSITLTPGTITLDSEGDDLTVHMLTMRDRDGQIDDHINEDMNRRVADLEGSSR